MTSSWHRTDERRYSTTAARPQLARGKPAIDIVRHQAIDPLGLVKLTTLMDRTTGDPQVSIGLIDGPVVTQHPGLAGENLKQVAGANGSTCTHIGSTACLHGTFVAGILSGRRVSAAPGICPNCTLLVCPIFSETASGPERMPSAKPLALAAAMIACIDAGARVINLSLGLVHPSTEGEQALEDALDRAVRTGVLVVAAAGNQRTVGSSAITRHPWVIPVVGCDASGRPLQESNLGSSIGRRGLSAPGDRIIGLGTGNAPAVLGGTSVAVPFVTGAIALLWSEFPDATASDVRLSIIDTTRRRSSVVPPLLNAAAAYESLLGGARRRMA